MNKKIINLASMSDRGSNRPRPSEVMRNAWLACRNLAAPQNASETELVLYGEIGYDWWSDSGLTAKTVTDFLAKLPNGTTEISVRINSPGGDVFEGVAMYNALINSGLKVHVKIDALAASIATVISMAGDTIEMAGNGQFMIHKAWTVAAGNADDMRSTADLLDSIDSGSIASTFGARTGLEESEILDLMKAETWFDAKAAKEKGFIDTIADLKGKPKAPEATESDANAKAEKAQLENSRLRNTHNKMRARLAA